ncbi:uncharacterized protein LOC134764225 [Penaeus indicus]|uniref:uncharacterized protein LOC134764225 n=1 Tax=Penaeus indicus TaxID=29960 RepID=UPI00300CCBB7
MLCGGMLLVGASAGATLNNQIAGLHTGTGDASLWYPPIYLLPVKNLCKNCSSSGIFQNNSSQELWPLYTFSSITNRLTTIHEGSSVEDWHYINSELNPADLASRGMYVNCDEEKISRWFQGPEFLSKPTSEWPESRNLKCKTKPDEMASKAVHATVINEDSLKCSLTNRYSTWTKLKRVVGWVILTCKKFKQKKNGEINKDIPLSKEILNEAEKLIVQSEQQNYFTEEVKSMKDTKTLNVGKGSPLYKLDPIITEGVLRVGGRLKNSVIPFERKHQIILPKQFNVSKLIYRTKLCEQKMADLPKERVTSEEPPFTKVGIDYFGPFEVKRCRTTVKHYGVIFAWYIP